VTSTRISALDPAVRKAALRLFTYGLYAVGVSSGDEMNLFTANWLTQVSFEPALIALSVENDSHSIALLRDSGVFAVSVFSSDERELAGALGKRWEFRPDKIDQVEYECGMTGCPMLRGAPAAVECRVTGTLPAGDSTLFLGEVIGARVGRDCAPLTMSAAGFRHAG
jgi:flavin reductase (DIM6/NTAB) family NADH-FMN oxidoreductase RutF